MTPKQEKLLSKITELGRLLTESEIIDFYIENNTRGTCRTLRTLQGVHVIEDDLNVIKGKALMCYRYGLGGLVQSGNLEVLLSVEKVRNVFIP